MPDARPIPSVRLSVRLSVTSRSTVEMVRDRPTVTIVSHHRATRRTHIQPLDHLFPQTEGSQPPVKNRIANCSQTVPNNRNSLWEHTYHRPTQQYYLQPVGVVTVGYPFSKRGSKIKFKTTRGREGKLACRVSAALWSFHTVLFFIARRRSLVNAHTVLI